MPELEFSLLRPLDPRALSETLRFQGALTARLAERLGKDAVERAFREVARFELPKDGDKFRVPLVSGQSHLLTSDSERRWAKAFQSQMLRSFAEIPTRTPTTRPITRRWTMPSRARTTARG